MAKDETKSHLLIGNKLLGTLLYTKDSLGRGFLKLSFKNKITDFVKWTETSTSLPAVLKLDKPSHLEISYKFTDGLLEIKRTTDGKLDREFYTIPAPFKNCLFVLRIKDWHLLEDDNNSFSPLILNPPAQTNDNIAIVFSFAGVDGKPLKPAKYACEKMGAIDLPEQGLSQFFIGICKDEENKEPQNLAIELFK